MSQTIDQILGGPNLTGVIQATTTGVPDVWPASFYSNRQPVDGDTGEYTKVTGTRQVARIAAYGSPSQVRALKDVAKIPVKLIHTVESVSHKPSVLTNLLNYADLTKQNLGIAEVTRQSREFKQLFDNLRVMSLTSMLFTGKINFDGSGSLLPTTSGAKVTVDYGLPATNLNQLNGIFDTTWATSTTKIMTQLSKLKKQSRRQTGYALKYAFYGENVPDYINANTAYRDFLKLNPVANAQHVAGGIADGFGGFVWLPAFESFYEDGTGAAQSVVGADGVLFTPEPSPEWLGWLEGTYPIPTSVGNITPDAAGSMANVQAATGMFSYGQVISDPVTVKQVAGDTFLPVLCVPGAIFSSTVAGF